MLTQYVNDSKPLDPNAARKLQQMNEQKEKETKNLIAKIKNLGQNEKFETE